MKLLVVMALLAACGPPKTFPRTLVTDNFHAGQPRDTVRQWFAAHHDWCFLRDENDRIEYQTCDPANGDLRANLYFLRDDRLSFISVTVRERESEDGEAVFRALSWELTHRYGSPKPERFGDVEWRRSGDELITLQHFGGLVTETHMFDSHRILGR